MKNHDVEYKSEYRYNDSKQNCTHIYLLKAIEKALSRILSLDKTTNNIKIFDAGCGNGYVAGCLIKKGFQVAGCDTSASGIEQARKTYPEGKFEVMSVYEDINMRFGNDWDVVISCEVIEHLFEPRCFINNLKNALRPGGLLIITTVYHGYLKNLSVALTGNMDRHFTALWDGGHIKFWSNKTIRALLIEYGFTDLKFHNTGRLPFIWKSLVVSAFNNMK